MDQPDVSVTMAAAGRFGQRCFEREVTDPESERYVCKAIAELEQMQEAGVGGTDGG